MNSHHGGVAFATTRWSLVMAAQGSTPGAKAALERLCQTYWPPIHAFLRRQSYGPEEAEDLTQGFFALILKRKDLDHLHKEKGRLRSYLLTSLKHFLANERRRALAIKRGQGQPVISLQELSSDFWRSQEAADSWTADQLYDRQWALALLQQVLRRLRDEYAAAGNERLFRRLSQSLTDDSSLSQAEIARDLDTTENAVKQAFHRFRRRYRQLLHEELAQTVTSPSDVLDELHHLVAVLRS